MANREERKTRNERIAEMLASGEGLKDFYRFTAQNPHIDLHDACQIVLSRPKASICFYIDEWNSMGRRVTKNRKGISFYDTDGNKQVVFDLHDTHGDKRYRRLIFPLRRLLYGLDELNGTSLAESNRRDYGKILTGVAAYLEANDYFTEDERRNSLLSEGVAYSLYCKTGFPKDSEISLSGMPYGLDENARLFKEVYLLAELAKEDISAAYERRINTPQIIDDIEEETVSDEPVIPEQFEQAFSGEQKEPATTEKTAEQGITEPDEFFEKEEEPEPCVNPLYARYRAAEQERPESVVLIRVGDFYEVFGDRAKETADLLNLTLTSRDVGLPERIPMCGFPHYVTDQYLEKILEHRSACLLEPDAEPIYILSHAETALAEKEQESEKPRSEPTREQEELADITEEFDESELAEFSDILAAEHAALESEELRPHPNHTEPASESPMPSDAGQEEGLSDDFEDEESKEASEAKQSSKQKDATGIQDRKRKQKPQVSMFDLLEPQEKSREEQIVDYCLKKEHSDYKLAYYDAYRKNLPIPEFVKLFKRHYGEYSGQSDGEKWITNTTKGREIKWRDKEHPENNITVQIKWPEVAVRIAELIENDDYLTPNEKEEYARVVRFRKERENAETDTERCKVIADQIVEYGTQKTYSEEFSEYPHFLEDYAQFYFDHREEIKRELLAHTEVADVGDKRDRFDYDLHVSFHIRYCPRRQESLRRHLMREHLVQDFADGFIEDCANHYETAPDGETIDWTVTPGEIGEQNYLFIKDNRDEFIEYLQSKAGVIDAKFSMDRIEITFDRDYIVDIVDENILSPGEQTRRVREIADRIIREGTQNTTEGNWVHFYDEFGEDETFVRENAEEIAEELERHQEVSDVELMPDAFDTNFYLDYCPNYILEEGEDGYGEYDDEPVLDVTQSNENADLNAVLDQSELGGAKERFKNNVRAIRLAKFLTERNAMATDEEKKVLAQYVGWGGLPQVFDETNKQWQKEYFELKSLLTAEEYEAAKGSVLNAHYTSKEVIVGIYAALARFGVKGNNRILEPALGTGNFFGNMPQTISNGATLYGVELDKVTGMIASKLYPQVNVQIKGFEETNFPNDYFDLAVSNVPFGGYGVYDSEYPRQKFLIHDYFIAKSIDKTKPGGIVAVITSKGTLDKLNPSARKYMAERAELLGAIRLPNTAFKQTANTEAVTDILFFQKREERISDTSGIEWLGTGKTQEGYEVNNYFISHPEMVLGTFSKATGMYGAENLTVKLDGRDFSESLAAAIERLPRGIYRNPERALSEAEKKLDEAVFDVRPMCYTAIKDKLYMRMGDRVVEQEIPSFPKDAYQRIQGMIGLRDELRRVLDMQTKGCTDEELQRAQWKLNAEYDRFVRRYGYVNSQTNARLFRDDGDAALVFASETPSEDKTKATKADIFTKRTIRPYSAPAHTSDTLEALQICRNERGGVDIAYIEELTGKTYDTVISELGDTVFRDPETVKGNDKYSGFVTSEEYLSGKVVEKLNRARRYAQTDGMYVRNVTALEQVQPEPLKADEISVRIGASWVDAEYYKEFLMHIMRISDYYSDGLDVRYNPFDHSWKVERAEHIRKNAGMLATETFGTERANAFRLFEDCLNQKATEIHDTIIENGKEKRVLNREETIAAREKQNKIREAFSDWIYADPTRREDLEKTYNRLFNQIRLPSYDGSYMKFPGMNPEIELRPHQKNAVARIAGTGQSTLLHHVVGSGKSYTMSASAMKLRQYGMAKKPMFVEPNHLVQQMANEFRRLYPTAKILIANKEDLEKSKRKQFVSKVAMGDWDAIIIAQSSFAKIPVSQERQKRMMNEEISKIEAAILEAREEGGARATVKNLERIKKGREAMLKKLTDSSKKDDVLIFENLGVDYLFVDEADSYKNLFLYTKMNNVSGISNAASARASDMLMKIEYLNELHGGDKGVVFATGTPISNSMAEMYVMQTYLQKGTLHELGIDYFDGWAADFGETVTALELAPSGQGYRARTRFAKFTNLPELMTLYRSFADVQTSDMVKLDVPEAERITQTLEPSETTVKIAEEIAKRAEAIYGGGVDPHIDNMLKVTSDGKKLALDVRCFDPFLTDTGTGKLDACAAKAAEVYEVKSVIRGTQIIFCDLSTPKKRCENYEYGKDFDVYNDLKHKLIARGIPAAEIAFIHDAKTDKEKQALFDKMNEGKIRILIGSTEKCGAGTNVQKRLAALHHLDAPYRPRDLQQRDGRGIRQGNMNREIKIFTYVTKRTLDSYCYQILENKQRFISQIENGSLTVREAEDIDETTLSYAEIKAITAANPKIKQKMELETELARLRVLEGQYKKRLYALQDKVIKEFPAQIRRQELRLENHKKDEEALSELYDPESFKIKVFETEYTDKKEGAAELMRALRTNAYEVEVAEYCGFRISLNVPSILTNVRSVTLTNNGSYTMEIGESELGLITRLENFIKEFPKNKNSILMKLESCKRDKAVAEEELKKPFEHKAKIEEITKELSEINAELDLNKREEVVIETDEESETEEEEINYMALPEHGKEQQNPEKRSHRRMTEKLYSLYDAHKTRKRDAVIFVKNGDYYETCGDDALWLAFAYGVTTYEKELCGRKQTVAMLGYDDLDAVAYDLSEDNRRFEIVEPENEIDREVDFLETEEETKKIAEEEEELEMYPDYMAVKELTEEGMKPHGDMLPIGRRKAKQYRKLGLPVYDITNGRRNVLEQEEIDTFPGIIGVDKREWNDFLKTDTAKSYFAARLYISSAAIKAANDDMSYMDGRYIDPFTDNAFTEKEDMKRYLQDKEIPEVETMYPYADEIMAEFVDSLSQAPLEYYGWTRENVREAIAGKIEHTELKTYIQAHSQARVGEITYERIRQSVITEYAAFEKYGTDELPDKHCFYKAITEYFEKDKAETLEKVEIDLLLQDKDKILARLYDYARDGVSLDLGNDTAIGELIKNYNEDKASENAGTEDKDFIAAVRERVSKIYEQYKQEHPDYANNLDRNLFYRNMHEYLQDTDTLPYEYFMALEQDGENVMSRLCEFYEQNGDLSLHTYRERQEIIEQYTEKYYPEVLREARQPKYYGKGADGAAYYCFPNGLSLNTLAEIRKQADEYIITAPSSALSAEQMREYKITYIKTCRDISDTAVYGTPQTAKHAMRRAAEEIRRNERNIESVRYNARAALGRLQADPKTERAGYKERFFAVFTEFMEDADGYYLGSEDFAELAKDGAALTERVYSYYMDTNDQINIESWDELSELTKMYIDDRGTMRMEAAKGTPLYGKPLAEASATGEISLYRSSLRANTECKYAIEEAINKNFDGNRLNKDFEKGIIDRFGMERVKYVLANTVQGNALDGRFSRETKDWANAVTITEEKEHRHQFELTSHPAVLDGFIARVIKAEKETEKKKGEELQDEKYRTQTVRGLPVVHIERDKYGHDIAIVKRQKDYVVAIGYDVKEGTWVQGRYDFPTQESAQEYIDEKYKSRTEGDSKWLTAKVSRDALIRRYDKHSFMRMPNGEYEDYTYNVFNSRIKESRQLVDMESDGRELCYELIFPADSEVTIKTRDGDEVVFPAQEFVEIVGGTSNADYERKERADDTVWYAISVPQEALRGAYEKSVLFSMPANGEFAGCSYYIPNVFVEEDKRGENGNILITLPEDFNITVKNRATDEEIVIMPIDLFNECHGTKGNDYARTPNENERRKARYVQTEIPLKAKVAEYKNQTLFRMPDTGEYAGYSFYLFNDQIKTEKKGIEANLSENFTVYLKDRRNDKYAELTADEFKEAMTGITDANYGNALTKPSESRKDRFTERERLLRKNLPPEMLARPNWVIVRTRKNEEKGKLDKFLISPVTGKFAEIDDPSTWTDFDTACKYASEHGGVSLAYALDDKANICCIDLDHCVTEKGFSALAYEAIQKSGKTYSEYSVSRSGLHIFGTTGGMELRSFSKDGDLEFYQKSHFITVTGDTPDGVKTLADFDRSSIKALLEEKCGRRAEWHGAGLGVEGLSSMSDRDVVEKACASKGGETFKAYYNGQDLKRNHSNSDMAFMNMLAFWCNGDKEQMLRIFASSGLYRPDKSPEYYEHTAMKAVRDITDRYQAQQKAVKPKPKAVRGTDKGGK